MSKMLIALALAGLTASACYAEDTTGTSKQAAEPAAAAVTTSGSARRMPSMALEAYKAAGVSDEQIAKLKALQDRIAESNAKGEKPDYAKLKEERDKILTPEQNEKYRAYLMEHRKAMMPQKPAEKAADKPAETK